MERKVFTWDSLMTSIDEAKSNPQDTAWNIYFYLKDHISADADPLTSEQARALLAVYMKMVGSGTAVRVPSKLHSCFLSIAVKMADAYPDFRFPAFLTMWGAENVRPEDMQRVQSADGHAFASLMERVTKAYLKYTLLHQNEHTTDAFRRIIGTEAVRMGYQPMKYMLATKMFESEHNGRKMRSVKMIDSEGIEVLADFHLFSMKPWEIVGRMYAVFTRVSKEEKDAMGNVVRGGNLRVSDIAPATKPVTDYFPTVMGYVDNVDSQYGHIHVFDAASRHFVADAKSCAVRVKPGMFVSFSPVIPKYDKFKSALIHQAFPDAEGAERFGFHEAKVTYVDVAKGFAAWELTDGTQIQEMGVPSPSFTKGYIHAKDGEPLPAVGTRLHLTVFLKRGKDKQKYPHVVRVM